MVRNENACFRLRCYENAIILLRLLAMNFDKKEKGNGQNKQLKPISPPNCLQFKSFPFPKLPENFGENQKVGKENAAKLQLAGLIASDSVATPGICHLSCRGPNYTGFLCHEVCK